MNPQIRATLTTESQLDARIDEFEQICLQQDGADIRDFLPSEDDPEFGTIAVELMRVEMEGSFRRGTPRRLQDYQARFSDVLNYPDRLSSLAFEEYRCRVQAGEHVRADDYRREFRIVTDGWPSDTQQDSRLQHATTETIVPLSGCGLDTRRLLEAIQPFPAVGDVFEGFRLVAQIGAGTFGTVFLAEQHELAGRPVVLKVTAGASAEPQHLARLQHTNIVPIFSVHRIDRLSAVCMPYLGRRTLSDLLRVLYPHAGRHEPQPTSGSAIVEALLDSNSERVRPESATEGCDEGQLHRLRSMTFVDACGWIGLKLAEALDHAHRRGILHRDIKPANVLLTDDGLPMLLDFNVSETLEAGRRMEYLIGGTEPYMSPEHRRSMQTGQRIDERADIYSLGVVLFQLITGQLPFVATGLTGASTRTAVVPCLASSSEPAGDGTPLQVSAVKADDLVRLNPQTSWDVASIVARCLAPQPSERYASAGELVTDLQRHLDSLPPRHVASRSVRERFQKWVRRHPRLSSATTIGSLAACALVAVVGWLMMRGVELRRLESLERLRQVEIALPTLRVVLSSPGIDSQTLHGSLEDAKALAAVWGHLEAGQWRTQTLVRPLGDAAAERLRDGVTELNFLIAAGLIRTAEMDSESADELWARASRYHQSACRWFADAEMPSALLMQKRQLQARRQAAELTVTEPYQARASYRSPRHQHWLAQQYLRQGKFPQAVEAFEQLRRIDAFDFSTWLLLGNAYAGAGRLSEAEGCYSACESLWPNSFLVDYNRALCRYEQGRFAAAEADWDRVIAHRDDWASAYFNRALARRARGDQVAALADLDRALELSGPEIRTLLVRARVHERLGQNALAERDRRASRLLAPKQVTDWTARALAVADEDANAALADLEQALRIAPESRHIKRNLAYLLGEKLQHTAEAVDLLTEMLGVADLPEDRMSRGVLFARLGQRDAAIEDGTRAIGDGHDDKLIFQMACIHSILSAQRPEDADQAVAWLARACLMQSKWYDVAARDPDLLPLRGHAGFRSFMMASHAMRRAAQGVNSSVAVPGHPTSTQTPAGNP